MRPLIVVALLLALHSPFPAAAAPVAAPATPEPLTSAQRKVDLNRASAAELVLVPGIGERLALAIVELRTKKGSFTKLDDLLEIRGIGEKSLAALSEHLTVAPNAPQAAAGVPPTARQ